MSYSALSEASPLTPFFKSSCQHYGTFADIKAIPQFEYILRNELTVISRNYTSHKRQCPIKKSTNQEALQVLIIALSQYIVQHYPSCFKNYNESLCEKWLHHLHTINISREICNFNNAELVRNQPLLEIRSDLLEIYQAIHPKQVLAQIKRADYSVSPC